jgi:ligand-binding SRPBCC domain-containing protein
MPKAARFRLVEAPDRVEVGSRFRYRIAPGIEWIAEIVEWNPPHGFSDLQVKGPYAYWRHTHALSEVPQGTLVRDSIEYRLRGGRLFDLLGHRLLLAAVFAYRKRRISAELG